MSWPSFCASQIALLNRYSPTWVLRLHGLLVLRWGQPHQVGQDHLLGLQPGHVQPSHLLQAVLWCGRIRAHQMELQVLDLELDGLAEVLEELVRVLVLGEAARISGLPVVAGQPPVPVH